MKNRVKKKWFKRDFINNFVDKVEAIPDKEKLIVVKILEPYRRSYEKESIILFKILKRLCKKFKDKSFIIVPDRVSFRYISNDQLDEYLELIKKEKQRREELRKDKNREVVGIMPEMRIAKFN